MAERRKTKSSNITSFGNSQVQRIHSDIHRIMDSREYDFYELEPLEVKEVLLDKNKLPKKSNGKPNYKYYGAIKGSWCNNKDQQILGDGVHILPIDTQIKRYPVVGENEIQCFSLLQCSSILFNKSLWFCEIILILCISEFSKSPIASFRTL